MRTEWRERPIHSGYYVRTIRVGDALVWSLVLISIDEGTIVAEDVENGNTWNVWDDGSQWYGPVPLPPAKAQAMEE